MKAIPGRTVFSIQSPIGDIPVFGTMHKSNIVTVPKGHVHLEIKGFAILGKLYGIAYLRRDVSCKKVVVTGESTAFIGDHRIVAAVSASVVISEEKFKQALKKGVFENVAVIEV